MDSKEKFVTFKASIGVLLIIVGFLTIPSGEYVPGDPSTSLATIPSITIGVVLIIIGYLIGKRNFKKAFYEKDKKFDE